MYASVIVPLDGFGFGEHALPLALNIARRGKIPLDLVHVNVPLAQVYSEYRPNLETPSDELSKRTAKSYVDEMTCHLQSLVNVPVRGHMFEGTVPETLHSFAADRPDSLVVMTTHGRGPISRFWLGSVTDAFVRVAPTSVLLVHPADGKPALGESPTLPHMLLPVDGSLLSEEVLETALTLGKLMDADYTLLRVVEPMVYIGQGALGDLPAVVDPGWTKAAEEAASDYLSRMAARLKDRALKVHTRVRVHPSVPLAILDEARAEGMSCIAMSTHGRHGLTRLALGSVTDKVVRGGTLPTLLSRPFTS
jgi:nucleotide-binding universal stress UspA family protein